jgi:hypothetical protein
MAEGFARSQAVMLVTREDLRRMVGGGWVSRIAAWRRPIVDRLRRRGWLR